MREFTVQTTMAWTRPIRQERENPLSGHGTRRLRPIFLISILQNSESFECFAKLTMTDCRVHVTSTSAPVFTFNHRFSCVIRDRATRIICRVSKEKESMKAAWLCGRVRLSEELEARV